MDQRQSRGEARWLQPRRARLARHLDDRAGRDRTPSVPGHELSGVVVELGYGTTGLTVGQRVFGLTDWTRNGSLAEYTAVEARNLAPLAADIDHTVAAALPISGLTETAAAFARHLRSPGKTIIQVAHDLEGMSVRDRRAVLAGGCFWRCRISSALALVFCSRVWATPGVTRPTPPTATTAHTPRPSRSLRPVRHHLPRAVGVLLPDPRPQHPEPAGQ